LHLIVISSKARNLDFMIVLQNAISFIKPYFILCRITLSFFAAASAAMGFLLVSHHRIGGVLATTFAVFLLACGASALNQYQERSFDARMERTRKRPIPSGSIPASQAMSLSIALAFVGLAILASAGGMKAMFLGLFALLWYNGIYTGLKKTTAFAAVPGAAVGMVPPAIGWVSAGGAFFDPRIAAVCFIFFMWQIPHFWIFLLRHGEDYKKAGLPSLTTVLSTSQIAHVTYAWIFAAAIATLMLPLYGVVRTPAFYVALIPSAAWLTWSARSLAARRPLLASAPLLFRKINIYLIFIMSLLVLENIFFDLP
jgi:protoheme IX farnesyltransferase